MKATSSFFVLVMICALPLTALAEMPENLKGTWVIDAKKTEDLLKKVSPPPKDAGFMAGIIGFWFQVLLEFDDEGLTVSAYTGARSMRYRFVSSQIEKAEYVLESPQNTGNDTLTVTSLGEKSINIKSSKSPYMDLCAWKHTNPLDPKAKVESARLAIETWKATMQSIAPVISATPNSAVNTDAAQ
ncbi:MAG TPA: hypothetical protein VMW50_12860 [Dehalococcoidia bacterium]|nr:hypothetical protein [Dehalococcoidia bacterium]